MRLTLLILMAIAMTGCATGSRWRRAVIAADQSNQQWQVSHPVSYQAPKRQLECTPTMEMNGNSRVLDCQ